MENTLIPNSTHIADPAAALFGDGSALCPTAFAASASSAFEASPALSLVGHWGFELFILLLSLLYLVWGSRRLSMLFGGLFRGESHTLDGSGGAHVGSNINASNGIVGGGRSSAEVVGAAMGCALIVGYLFLLFSKGSEAALSPSSIRFFELEFRLLGHVISGLGFGWWLLALSVGTLLLSVWFMALLGASHFLSRSSWLYGSLLTLRSDLLLFVAVVTLPALLLSALDYGAVWALWYAFIILNLSVLYYLLRTFLLFTTQKVSLLHWFLYLCTVEILPLTLLWKLLVR